MWIAAVFVVLSTVTHLASNNSQTCDFNKASTLPLRGLLAILIVAAHCCNYLDSNHITPPHWLYLTMEIRELAKYVVGGFFFISGYGVASIGGITSLSMLSYRFKKVLIPFLWFLIIFQLILSVLGDFDMIRTTADLMRGSTPYFLPNCWFVFVLLAFYLFIYVLTRITTKILTRCTCLLFISIVFIGILYLIRFQTHWYTSVLAVPIGYICACYRSEFFRLMRKKKIQLSLGISTLFLLYLTSISSVFHLFAIPLVSVIVIEIVVCFGVYRSRMLNYLGTISYEIYLSHGIVLYCIGIMAINDLVTMILFTLVSTIFISAISRSLINVIHIK